MSTVKVVVPVSGGKDSQAALKLAAAHFHPSEIRGLFCDTKFEHPWTYEHVEKLRTLYGPIQIDTVNAGSVEEQVLKHGMFPVGGARFCTKELKIIPTKLYCRDLAATQGGFEVWYGMRSDESAARTKRYAGKICDELYHPHEVLGNYPKYLGKMGVRFRLELLEWSEQDVFDYLVGDHNWLYDNDFDRCGCFPCLASGDAPKEQAFAFDEFGASQRRKVIMLSQQIGKSPFTSKGGISRNGDMCALHCGG